MFLHYIKGDARSKRHIFYYYTATVDLFIDGKVLVILARAAISC